MDPIPFQAPFTTHTYYSLRCIQRTVGRRNGHCCRLLTYSQEQSRMIRDNSNSSCILSLLQISISFKVSLSVHAAVIFPFHTVSTFCHTCMPQCHAHCPKFDHINVSNVHTVPKQRSILDHIVPVPTSPAVCCGTVRQSNHLHSKGIPYHTVPYSTAPHFSASVNGV